MTRLDHNRIDLHFSKITYDILLSEFVLLVKLPLGDFVKPSKLFFNLTFELENSFLELVDSG